MVEMKRDVSRVQYDRTIEDKANLDHVLPTAWLEIDADDVWRILSASYPRINIRDQNSFDRNDL